MEALSNQDASEVKNFEEESTREFHLYDHSKRYLKRETIEALFANAYLDKDSEEESTEALRAKRDLDDESIEAPLFHADPEKNSKKESTKAPSIRGTPKKRGKETFTELVKTLPVGM